MYKIDKEFNWDMGHRVWSQTLNAEYALDNTCICRRLHGHSYKAKIGLQSENLKNGMVTDFKHLNFVKEFIDNFLDHKFMIDRNDPLFEVIFPEFEDIQRFENSAIKNEFWFKYVDISKLKNFEGIALEHIESFVIVDFVPTSENICKFLYEYIKAKMEYFLESENIKVAFVELWETPKSHCVYGE